MNSPIVGASAKLLTSQSAQPGKKFIIRKYWCSLDPLIALGLLSIAKPFRLAFKKDEVNHMGLPIRVKCPCDNGNEQNEEPHPAYLDGSFQLPPKPFWRR